MSPVMIEVIDLAAILIFSAFISEQIAKKKGRDRYFYFISGLLTGPFAILIVVTPLPQEVKRESLRRRIRYVKGSVCPNCKREVALRSTECEHCGYNLEVPWWERL
ncbi:MAG: hypothetical protein PHP64_00045 [Actinomycetota bacterium]|nr:hypothetical protein [Actinomycetota bacterium]